MTITDVRIKVISDTGFGRLCGFASIIIDDCFCVRDLKVIDRGAGRYFISMPSRKITDHCAACGGKNALAARHCCACGERLADDRAPRDGEGRQKLYADIAHPVTVAGRRLVEAAVLGAYRRELVLADQPGYVCRYDDYGNGEA